MNYTIPRHYELVGSYLQKMRLKAGLSQKDVSEKLGYSTAQFISNFERGITTPPVDKLKILIKLYNMPVNKVVQLILEAEKTKLFASLAYAGKSKRT